MRNKSSHRSGQPTRLDSAVKEQSADFWKSKTLEELAAEQGIHPVENLDEVLGQGADLWRDDAEDALDEEALSRLFLAIASVEEKGQELAAVSYTHLTLPTTERV